MICCHEVNKIESSVNAISDKPETEEDYEYSDESNQCEIYFAGAGTSFGSLTITQQEKDEHLTYE